MNPKFFLPLLICTLMFIPVNALKETTIYMPAVQETDYGTEGVMATLTVDVREGSGHVYVDTWPLAKIDTQASARMAKEVACETLFIDCSQFDFYYTIRSDAKIVGGPSGGSAMAVATMASLLDLEINNHVLITGTINPDGSIGSVSGLLEKAQAASEKGNTFLIPSGQTIVTPSDSSSEINLADYALENWNLTVIEVQTVADAFEYFTNYKIEETDYEFEKTAEYQKVMKMFGEELIAHAEDLQAQCRSDLKQSKINYEASQEISELCEMSLEDAEAAFSKKDYYSAASIAFSNSITYKNGIKLIELLSSADKKEFTKIYLDSIDNQELEIDTGNIELYAIVEERYSDVQKNLETAWKNYYDEGYSSAVYYGAFAEERLYTAVLWNMHSGEFPNYISKSEYDLEAISNELISQADSILTYSSLLVPNTFSAVAEDFIESAREEQKKGNYYSAIIFALKGKANAEIASEVSSNSDYEALIELHKKRALVSLNQTESVIGQSYFEYAQTLEDTNLGATLTYYTYSEKLSKLNNLLNQEPVWDDISPTEYIEPLDCEYETLIPIYLVSLLICFVIGLLL